MTHEIAAVVLAAGAGTRMRSRTPKVLQPVAGLPMVGHVLAAVDALAPTRVVVVLAPGDEATARAVAPRPTAVQPKPLGTGDAVRAALPALEGVPGTVLVVFGDWPLIRPETLRRLVEARHGADDPAIAFLVFRPADPGLDARVVTGPDGTVEGIVEARDATPEQLEIGLCNGGIMAFCARRLPGLIARLGNSNAKNEYYLTEAVALARASGWAVRTVETDEAETLGVDTKAALARAEAAMQERLRARALESGAALVAPETVFFSHDTRLARDVVVHPYVVFGPGVDVGEEAEIRSFCHIEGASIAAGARIGPYARLRPGSEIGEGAHIGNFVETKEVVVGKGAKANHLTYLGDATVGAGANVGAGTITCNYDGIAKHRTEIGAGAFIGSNTALVAPVSVGEGAMIAAGSTITRPVGAGALAVARGEQREVAGGATRFRERRAQSKAKSKEKA